MSVATPGPDRDLKHFRLRGPSVQAKQIPVRGSDGSSDKVAPTQSLLRRHAGALVAVTAALMCLPFLRSVSGMGDEGILLHAASRMNDGQMLYRDFFEFHPPLGFVILSGWMALFGPSLLAARLLVVLIVAATAWLAFDCGRRLSGRPGLSALLILTWVAASQGEWTAANHHWLTSFFSLLTLWTIMAAGTKRGWLAMAGLSASAATLVTTHRGALVVLAGLFALLSSRSIKALALYAGGGLALFIAILGWLASRDAAGPAFEQVIVYTTHNYAQIQGVRFGAFVDRQTALAVAAFPFAAVLLVFALYREGFALFRRPHWREASLFALAGLLGCFPRPDAVHICFCVVLALPLLCGLLAILTPGKWTGPPRAFALAVLALPLAPLAMLANEAMRGPRIETHAGRIALTTQDGAGALIERLGALPPDDSVFFYPYDPLLPFLTGRRHPARLDVLQPQYSPPSQYEQSCREAMRDAQWVVFDLSVSNPAFFRATYPALTDPSPPEKRALEAALYKGFVLDARYGVYQLLRRGAASPDLCAD